MKKYRQFIIGFVVGAMLFGTASIAAESSKSIQVLYRNIKIAINGKTIATDSEPFVYNSRTYVPVRFVAEAFGKEVRYNETTDTVEITDTAAAQATPKDNGTITVPVVATPSEYEKRAKTYVEDGLTIREVDGEKYVLCGSIYDRYQATGYRFKNKMGPYAILEYHNSTTGEVTVILDWIRMQSGSDNPKLNNRDYITYEYFQQTIKPLIKTGE
jgi:hypothetical protein